MGGPSSQDDYETGKPLISHLMTGLRQLRGPVLAVYAFAAFTLTAVVTASAAYDIPLVLFFRDPAAIMDAKPYYGFMSNLGVLLWCASVTISLLTASLLAGRSEHRRAARFLLVSGLYAAMMMADDFFMFHDSIFPTLFGWWEKWVILSYALILMTILVAYRRVIVSTNFVPLILSLGFFGASVVFDALQSRVIIPAHHLFEDGSKFLGIVSWLVYFYFVSRSVLTSALALSSPSGLPR